MSDKQISNGATVSHHWPQAHRWSYYKLLCRCAPFPLEIGTCLHRWTRAETLDAQIRGTILSIGEKLTPFNGIQWQNFANNKSCFPVGRMTTYLSPLGHGIFTCDIPMAERLCMTVGKAICLQKRSPSYKIDVPIPRCPPYFSKVR